MQTLVQNCSRALISATSEPKTITTINFRHMKQPFSRPTKDSSGTGMMGCFFSSDTSVPVSLFYFSLSAKIADTEVITADFVQCNASEKYLKNKTKKPTPQCWLGILTDVGANVSAQIWWWRDSHDTQSQTPTQDTQMHVRMRICYAAVASKVSCPTDSNLDPFCWFLNRRIIWHETFI